MKGPGFLILIFLSLLYSEGFSQVTYTSNGSGGWIRTPATGGCSTTTPNSSPIQGSATCQIILNINHPVNFSNIDLGVNVIINVNSNGTLNVSGNLSVRKGGSATINLNGGNVNIGGELGIASTGTGGSSATLNIGGNGQGGEVRAENLNLNNPSNLNIRPEGKLVVSGETRFAAGGGISIVNEGYFQTKNVEIQGRATIENKGAGVMVVEENFKISGSAELTVDGDSEIEIGGDLIVDGNAKLSVVDNASVLVCNANSEMPDEDSSNITVERPNAILGREGCRILPVNLLGVEFLFNSDLRQINLLWSTAKEWENSHFEIERALNSTDKFEIIGQVQGNGWTEVVSEYSFVDENLPLKGGNIFYRLKQVDFNGKFEYSEIMAVRVPSAQFTHGVWRAYPNPTEGSGFQVELLDNQQYNGERILCRIFSSTTSSGQLTFKDLHELQYGVEELLNAVRPGLWILEVHWGDKVERIKIVKR